jgi:hypothetical protein
MISWLVDLILLILATTVFHGLALGALVRLLITLACKNAFAKHWLLRIMLLPLFVMGMLIVAVGESSLWGAYYVHVGLIEFARDAIYFSIITMTTVGYGDITLVADGRTISGVQAALGIVLFGWTTAAIVTLSELLYRPTERYRELLRGLTAGASEASPPSDLKKGTQG